MYRIEKEQDERNEQWEREKNSDEHKEDIENFVDEHEEDIEDFVDDLDNGYWDWDLTSLETYAEEHEDLLNFFNSEDFDWSEFEAFLH